MECCSRCTAPLAIIIIIIIIVVSTLAICIPNLVLADDDTFIARRRPDRGCIEQSKREREREKEREREGERERERER
jgi:flagellar basal body-associated protein FliL